MMVAFVAAALLAEHLMAVPQSGLPPKPALPQFRDLAAQRGLTFTHVNGASEAKHFPEIMGSGGLFFDFDDDGWLDVFLVDGGSFADSAVARTARHRLFKNRGDGSFADVTEASGIRHRNYGMGACAGDYDNDGRIDLYITNVGPNALYRNTGSGKFSEVSKAGGADASMWSTSCAFLDIDRDGDLDLFVTNYVDAQQKTNQFCGVAGPPPIRDYCHPLIYPPLTNVIYRNNGGKFEDISKSSGVGAHRGNGLGVAVGDVDDDGLPDVFVANDGMPNFLFHNKGNGSFDEIAPVAGVAVAIDGKARAGMGTAFADFAGTGRLGLVVTNHETEMHSLFLNTGGRLFSDVTIKSGVGPTTRPYVGFGVAFVDYDNDTRPDIAVANGNVMANAAQLRAGGKYAQRNLLLRNLDGHRFLNVKEQAGPGFAPEMVSRGLASGDIDNDGDVDLLITNNGAAPNLLINDGGSGNAFLVRVIGTKSNRSGIGTRLVLTAAKSRQLREVQSGSSYLSQNDLRAHFGLGTAEQAERLEIRWPGGATETIENVAANQIITVREGGGIVNRIPFAR